MEKQTAGRDNLTGLADKFAQLNDDVLFGEVWSREDKLSLRDRSMITISALMAQGLYPQLKSHLILGKKHGVTKMEVVEMITQLAFYCGWPKAWTAFGLVKEVYGDDENQHGGVFGLGQENVNYAKYFIGKSYLNPLTGKIHRFLWLMLPLNQVVEIIGIFIMLPKVVDRSLSVLMALVGIKSMVSLLKV